MKTNIPFPRSTNTSITKATIIRAAWAVVLARYCDTDDVCFGTTVSGRQAPVYGVERMVGPAVATVPVRVRLDRQRPVSTLLDTIQRQAAEMVAYEQFGVQNISRLSANAKDICNFSSLLIIQPMQHFTSSDHATDAILLSASAEAVDAEEAMEGYFNYPLVLQAITHDGHLELVLIYDAAVLPKPQLEALSYHFEHVLHQLLAQTDAPLHKVSIAGNWDLQQAMHWNTADITASQTCVHTIISEQALRTPHHEAIYSSEGTMTYATLDQLSTQFAAYLFQLGVELETMVPICYEKSMWTIVAMLGIMKAGGAFVPLDPSHPTSRRRAIIKDIDAQVMIVSPKTTDSCQQMTNCMVELSPSLMAHIANTVKDNSRPHIPVTSSNTAYLIFTSGSTGKPKAITVDHSALSTSLCGNGKAYAMHQGSRVLQFSSYVFDVSLSEILETLVSGGTVCIPSETDRLQNISGFIAEARVNTALLTSTFLRTLTPGDVPSLETLILVGEPPAKDILNTWLGHVTVANAYGPSEVCMFCTSHVYQSAEEPPATVGRPYGGACWIVEPDNHNRLAPIGCTGELLVQRQVAKGYYRDSAKTKEAFFKSVEWLPTPSANFTGQFYKTGDFAKYHFDGTIEYLGRRDMQVKVRGHRVELEEVEYSIKQRLANVDHVAVDVIRGHSIETLVAFINFPNNTPGPQEGEIKDLPEWLLEIDESLRETLRVAIEHVKTTLPKYSIPSVFLPLRRMPFVTSMKLDRKKLREFANNLSQERLTKFSLGSEVMVEPTTEMEFRLRDIWAQVLKTPAEGIGKNDSFLQVGGDSILAIRLVTLAQQRGIGLTITNIFADSRLSQMASAASSVEIRYRQETEPFSLLSSGGVKAIKSSIRKDCGLISEENIEDVYPCTSLQEGLMALAVKQPGSYITKNVYRLSKGVDSSRFKASWARTVELCGNLRTRIILHQGGTLQALIKEDPAWEATDGCDIRSVIRNSKAIKMQYGERLCRYGLMDGDHDERYFVLVIHHAVFDGWSLNIVLDTLYRVYRDIDIPRLQPYAGFIDYVINLDQVQAGEYWKAQLDGAHRASFPPQNRHIGPHSASRTMKTNIPFPRSTNTSITKATILRAAWAVVLARYCDTDDVCFGTTVSGRHAPVFGVERMAGPAVATVPVRVRLDRQLPVRTFLEQIQQQASDMVAYEQFGLQKIARLGSPTKEACDFSSLMVIQPTQHVIPVKDATETAVLSPAGQEYAAEEGMEGYFTYPLVVQGLTHIDSVELHLTYDPCAVFAPQLRALSYHFKNVVKQLLTQDTTPLGSLHLSGEYDLRHAIDCNGEGPELVRACVHELVEAQAKCHPDSPAICAWDGQLTYSQLDIAANRLAHYLVRSCGVRIGDLVHVCFEKSVWFFAVILAVNKAGAAWVPLDPSHPAQRHQQIVQQTGASLCLASRAQASKCAGLVVNVIEVTPALDQSLCEELDRSPTAPLDGVSPDLAAYVLFTSGTTGTPKGLIMQHGAVCTSQTAVSERLRTTHDVRILQFASFVFDLCIGEIIGPLISGACLCVPSEEIRMNGLKEFMRDIKVNWAFMTPSFARTLRPEDVPSLELLLLAGEAVPRDVFDTWFGKVRLINGWGPAETCVFSTLHEWQSETESPLTIGRPVGGYCWIVDPEDPQLLAPAGCLGEVVIQGPTLLREYLSDAAKTEASTVASLPEWAPRRTLEHWNRFYRSGDLCSYNADGTIEFSSRKDTQIKIRGLRVELGEVEYHVQATIEGVRHVVADVLKGEAGSSLVSFFCFNNDARNNDGVIDPEPESVFLQLSPYMRELVAAAVGKISVRLPGYMVPTIFIPCKYMPSITSTKLDRAQLRRLAAALGHKALLSTYSLVDTEKRPPATAMEVRMHGLWTQILNLPAECISRDDSFLGLGGDSITAIQLVTSAREAGISITVKNIFDDARLSAVSAKAAEAGHLQMRDIAPFSMLPTAGAEEIKSSIRGMCNLSSEQDIEDAYPCTSLQEGLMALAVKQPGSYIAKYVYRLHDGVDINRFKASWGRTVQICGNLRTRIILREGTTFQVLIKDEPAWEATNGCTLRSMMNNAKVNKMQYGEPLCRYGLVDGDHDERYFVLIIHHAVFDGWSLNVVLDTLYRVYRDIDIPRLQSYAGFIDYVVNLGQVEAGEYWKAQLDGAHRASFPPQNRHIGPHSASRIMKTNIPFPRSTNTSITKATILRAAWAVVLARYCDTDDVLAQQCPAAMLPCLGWTEWLGRPWPRFPYECV